MGGERSGGEATWGDCAAEESEDLCSVFKHFEEDETPHGRAMFLWVASV